MKYPPAAGTAAGVFTQTELLLFMDRLKKLFSKSKSVTITESGDGRFFVVISRSSRFIRKDAEKLIAKFADAGVTSSEIILTVNAPLCSKAKAFLQDKGYTVCK